MSTDILAEYEEVIKRMLGRGRWQKVTRLMDLADAASGSVLHVATYYHFLAISGDRDDDQFADCAISVSADCIITSDRHFESLRGLGYKPQPIHRQNF